jgi:NAD(P)-dependent dehydrogenase (short-subunit alcohol dehydrogenase family)
MRKQNRGTIINISSVAGIEPFPHMDSYVASKFALESLSESQAVLLSPWNINVCLIEPGAVHTQGPANMKLGTRINEDTTCFSKFNQTVFSFMRSRLEVPANEPGFSHPIEIAQCIEQIITTDKPLVRYQVGPDAPGMAAARFVDPTGNSYIEKKKKQLASRGFMQTLQTATEEK